MKKITEFTKLCPECEKSIYYSNKYGLKNSIKNNTKCQSCTCKRIHNTEDYKKSISEKVKKSWQDPGRLEKSLQGMKLAFERMSPEKRSKWGRVKGFKVSEKTKILCSDSSKNLWKNKDFKKKMVEANACEILREKRKNIMISQLQNPLSKINSIESKNKRKSSMKKCWQNSFFREKMLNHFTNMVRCLKGSSKLERFVCSKLEHLGFIHQGVVASYCVDIINEDLKIVVEVNGDFWHANPEIYHSNWVNPKTKKNAAEIWQKDKNRLKKIREAGYEVIVLWQKDIYSNYNFVDIVNDIIFNRECHKNLKSIY